MIKINKEGIFVNYQKYCFIFLLYDNDGRLNNFID